MYPSQQESWMSRSRSKRATWTPNQSDWRISRTLMGESICTTLDRGWMTQSLKVGSLMFKMIGIPLRRRMLQERANHAYMGAAKT